LGIAAVSHDSVELLRNFAERKGLAYPLLSDPESKVIRAFGILNENFPRDNAWYGVPYPGTYVLDERGVVKAKYFEDDHRERYTAASILFHELGADGSAKTTVETPHVKISYGASDASLSPGGRATLIVDLELKPGMHVYAPGVEGGYLPIEWKMPESKGWLAHAVDYPASRKLRLEAINETVLVYSGQARLSRDLTVGQQPEVGPLLGPERTLTVEGSFRYQACDEMQCFPPRTVPLKWTFKIDRLDSQRAPVELRRKGEQ